MQPGRRAAIRRPVPHGRERRPRERAITPGLEGASRREEPQKRDPQARVAEGPERDEEREVDRERDQHEVAHRAGPGGTDEDAIELERHGTRRAASAQRRAESSGAVSRTAGLVETASTKAAPPAKASSVTPPEKITHQRLVSRTARRKPTPSPAPTDCPHICSAAVAKPSRKKAEMRKRFIRTALAASITSPPRAPCAVKKAKAKISEAERIMMSRLTPSMRSERRAVGGPPPVDREAAVEPQQHRGGPAAAPSASATRVPVADPRTPRPKPATRVTFRAMLPRLISTWSRSPMSVRPRPMTGAEHHVVHEREGRRPDADVVVAARPRPSRRASRRAPRRPPRRSASAAGLRAPRARARGAAPAREVTRSSSRSPAPTAWAVIPAVPRRRNPSAQNTKSKITAAAAIAPSSAGSPSRASDHGCVGEAEQRRRHVGERHRQSETARPRHV